MNHFESFDSTFQYFSIEIDKINKSVFILEDYNKLSRLLMLIVIKAMYSLSIKKMSRI